MIQGAQNTRGAGSGSSSGGGSADSGKSNAGGTSDAAAGSSGQRCEATVTLPNGVTRCPRWGDTRDGYDVSSAGSSDSGASAITLSDIARFRPASTPHRMEPDGWAVIGLPANFFTVAHQQVVSGELLGSAAEVRFTPVAFAWDYGDGTRAESQTSGATWAALGLREFDRTPTSHVFRSQGTFVVRLSTVFRAEYRIGDGPFVPIAGVLVVPANELRVTVGSAKTVLVDRDCARNRAGPGC